MTIFLLTVLRITTAPEVSVEQNFLPIQTGFGCAGKAHKTMQMETELLCLQAGPHLPYAPNHSKRAQAALAFSKLPTLQGHLYRQPQNPPSDPTLTLF